MASDIDDQILQDLYSWIDEVPLSRQKRNITRDFSDGVMMAELVKYYFPHLVDLHSYPSAQAATQKKKNWHLLNWKVFKKLNFELSNEVVDSLVNCKPGTVERVLLLIRTKIDRTLFERKRMDTELPKVRGDQSNRPMRFTERTLGATGGGGVSDRPSLASPPRNRNSLIPPAKAGFQQASLVSQADVVPRLAYEERVQECLGKEEMISVLQSKIRKMEHLLHLKDIRIDELSRRSENSRPTAAGVGGVTPTPGSKVPFGRPNALPMSMMPQQQQQQQQQSQFQPPGLTQAQLQQLQMQFGPPPYGMPMGQPPMGMDQPPMGMGQPPMGMGQPPGAQYNPNFPPFMPLPPIAQPHASGNAQQMAMNNKQDTMVSAE